MTDVNQTKPPTSSEEAAVLRLKKQLSAYAPSTESERSAQELMLRTLGHEPRCFERDCLPGHFTASVWAVSASTMEVALVHHRKLKRWLQPGGHADGNPLLLPVGLRELQEETGLTTYSVAPGIFDLDVHTIPATSSFPEHLHLDVRYAVLLPQAVPLQCSEESHEVAWVPLAALKDYLVDAAVLRMAEKTARLKVPADTPAQ